jgi:hypothetical protein
MPKSIRFKMTDKEGQVCHWNAERFTGQNLTLGRRPRQVSGWSYTDHEGYQRNVEGNWLDLVAAFKLTADNYGFSTTIS